MERASHAYRVEYVAPGSNSVTTTLRSEMQIEAGQRVTVDGVYLVVERIVTGKRGDPYDGLALCKLAHG